MRLATLLRRRSLAPVALVLLGALPLVACGRSEGESHRAAADQTTSSADASAQLCPGVAAHGQHTSCDADDRKVAKPKGDGALAGGDPGATAKGGGADDRVGVGASGDGEGAASALDQESGAAAPPPPADVPQKADPAASPTTAPTTAPTAAPTSAPTAPAKDDKVVEFHIKAGTGKGAWNTQAEMLVVKVGQVVHVVNDDTVTHRLHTNGAPCPHGSNFAAGATFDCVASKAFDPAGPSGPVYDHIAGTSAQFWLKVVP
jgi:hypothetical protein